MNLKRIITKGYHSGLIFVKYCLSLVLQLTRGYFVSRRLVITSNNYVISRGFQELRASNCLLLAIMQPSVLTQTPRQLYRQISWFWTRPSTSLPFVRSSPLFTQIAKFPLPVSSPPLCPHFLLIFVSFSFTSLIALFPFFLFPPLTPLLFS